MWVWRIERFRLAAHGPVLDAEARVLVGQLAAALVLLPEQLQRDARALEFLVDPGVVGLELVARARHRRAVQPGLELLVGQASGPPPSRRRRRAPAARTCRSWPCADADGAARSGRSSGRLQSAGCRACRILRIVILVVGMAGRKTGQHAYGQDHPRAAAIVHDQTETPSTISLKQRLRSL